MSAQVDAIEFYWRPGCGFCALLDRQLTRMGFTFEMHNIWEDPAAAAFVRSVASGNETVPTIRVGSAAMVNPAPEEVEATVAALAPHLMPNTSD